LKDAIKRGLLVSLPALMLAVVIIMAGSKVTELRAELKAQAGELEELQERNGKLVRELLMNAARANTLEDEAQDMRAELGVQRVAAMEEHQRAVFWYKWQHSKNGPHCARALRLMGEYEKDAVVCGTPDHVATPSMRWWCEERQKRIETNTNKVELR
jgi:hypothetical protein